MLYFDHNATTPIDPEVAEVLLLALREVPGNASSTHRFGQLARQRLESARLQIAADLGCTAPELVFTSGGTESNNLAISGLVRALGQSNPHVVTTAIEHPAVLEPVRRLEREGVCVTRSGPSFGEIEEAIRPETVLVSVMHANNETGQLQPIAELARLVQARRRGGQAIYLHSDGVQALGKVEVRLDRLGVDLYSLSAHKIYGPKGVGALFARKGTPLAAMQVGGRQERERRAGTENVPGIVAFARAIQLALRSPLEAVRLMRDRFENSLLAALDKIEINGSHTARLPNTSNVLFTGLSGEVLLIALDTAGFAVSTGSACSSGSIEPSPVLLAMGRTASEARSSVRFSFGRDHTSGQVDQLSAAVIEAVRRLRKASVGRLQLART